MRRRTFCSSPSMNWTMSSVSPPSIREKARCSCCSFTQSTPAAVWAARCSTAAHGALRAAGCSEAFLYTHEENERALTVYEAAGYRRDGSVWESDFRGFTCGNCGWRSRCDQLQCSPEQVTD